MTAWVARNIFHLYTFITSFCLRYDCRLLKPGGLFCIYEWLMTDKYNPHDEGHRKIKEGIMVSKSYSL